MEGEKEKVRGGKEEVGGGWQGKRRRGGRKGCMKQGEREEEKEGEDREDGRGNRGEREGKIWGKRGE